MIVLIDKEVTKDMKKIAFIFSIILCLAMSFTINVQAQSGKSQAERAEKRSGRLTTALALTEAQQKQVQQHIQAFIQKRDALKGQGGKSPQAMKPLRQELDANINSVLTPEQQKKYAALKEEAKNKIKDKHKNKKGKKPALEPEYEKAVEDMILE